MITCGLWAQAGGAGSRLLRVATVFSRAQSHRPVGSVVLQRSVATCKATALGIEVGLMARACPLRARQAAGGPK